MQIRITFTYFVMRKIRSKSLGVLFLFVFLTKLFLKLTEYVFFRLWMIIILFDNGENNAIIYLLLSL